MRKLVLGLLAVVALLASSAVPSHAWWHGLGGWRGPVFVGPRLVVGVPLVVAPPVFYPRPYVYPAPVVVAAPPPLYVQSQPSWYYCQSLGGYYPAVPQCPGGWLQVAPQQ